MPVPTKRAGRRVGVPLTASLSVLGACAMTVVLPSAPAYAGLCLEVSGNGSDTGQQLDQWPCKNAPGTNQDFNPR